MFLLVSATALAQYDVVFSHYFDMETSYNPAAVGKTSVMNVNVAYAMDLAGFEHNPQTAYISGDMPFIMGNSTNGVGLVFMNDKLGLFSHMRLEAQYAIKQRLAGGTLSVGVQAGLLSETFDGSKLDLADSNDPAFSSSELNGNGLDVAAGVYYSRKNWYAGLSAQHLTAPTIHLGETNELKIKASYYATAGYDIQLRNPMVKIKTSGLARYDGTMFRGDVTARLFYTNENRLLYGGLGYSPTNSVTLMIGGKVQEFILGYSYEWFTSGVNPGYGSHELHVGYQMDINLTKKGKNLHKSVRLL